MTFLPVRCARRLQRLRAALTAVNRLLPPVGGPNGPSWRPFVPLSGLEAQRHVITRFFEDEAFVLSTKERVPYLVFVETISADQTPAQLASPPPHFPHRAGGLPHASRNAAMAGFSRFSLAVAGRAAMFAKRRTFSFERMPSSRRSRGARHSSDCSCDATCAEAAADGRAGLTRSMSCAPPELPAEGRPRSNSDPEVVSAEPSAVSAGAEALGYSMSAALAGATARTSERAGSSSGLPVPMPPPSAERGALAPVPPPSEPEPERPAEAAGSARLLDEPRRLNDSDLAPLRAAVEGVAGADDGDDDDEEDGRQDDEVDYTVNEGFGELWQTRADRLRSSSLHAAMAGWAVHAFIVKSNDELLQEQFAVSLIREFDRIFRHARLPLRLQPYRILATSPTSGLIEVVPNAKSLDSVKKSTPNYFSLLDFFRRRYGGPTGVAFHRARRNFVQSVAAYSVISYLLQIKDRHNGNILLHANGSVVHIDFGFLLSNSPGKNLGFEAAPFKLTSEWVELMGGIGSPWFRYFSTLVVRGFQEARRHRDKLLLIVQSTYRGVDGALPCFRAGEHTIEALRQRFQPDMTNQQYARFAAGLIDGSLDNVRPRPRAAARACARLAAPSSPAPRTREGAPAPPPQRPQNQRRPPAPPHRRRIPAPPTPTCNQGSMRPGARKRTPPRSADGGRGSASRFVCVAGSGGRAPTIATSAAASASCEHVGVRRLRCSVAVIAHGLKPRQPGCPLSTPSLSRIYSAVVAVLRRC